MAKKIENYTIEEIASYLKVEPEQLHKLSMANITAVFQAFLDKANAIDTFERMMVNNGLKKFS